MTDFALWLKQSKCNVAATFIDPAPRIIELVARIAIVVLIMRTLMMGTSA